MKRIPIQAASHYARTYGHESYRHAAWVSAYTNHSTKEKLLARASSLSVAFFMSQNRITKLLAYPKDVANLVDSYTSSNPIHSWGLMCEAVVHGRTSLAKRTAGP
jgi:hypothetical protein